MWMNTDWNRMNDEVAFSRWDRTAEERFVSYKSIIWSQETLLLTYLIYYVSTSIEHCCICYTLLVSFSSIKSDELNQNIKRQTTIRTVTQLCMGYCGCGEKFSVFFFFNKTSNRQCVWSIEQISNYFKRLNSVCASAFYTWFNWKSHMLKRTCSRAQTK